MFSSLIIPTVYDIVADLTTYIVMATSSIDTKRSRNKTINMIHKQTNQSKEH